MLELYTQAEGLQCLLSDAPVGERLPAMLTSPLAWWWTSQRRYAPSARSVDADLPPARDLTRVTTTSLPELVQDWQERDLNDDGRELTLWATTGTAPPQGADIADFARGAPPVRLVLVRLGDEDLVRVFIPRTPIPAVSEMLIVCGCDPTHATRRRLYRRLRTLRYERLFLS